MVGVCKIGVQANAVTVADVCCKFYCRYDANRLLQSLDHCNLVGGQHSVLKALIYRW